jgi:hypothetical protein
LICLQGHRTNCRAAESVRVIRLSIPLEEDSSTSTLNLLFMLLFSRFDSSSEPGFSCTLRACNHYIRYLGRHQPAYPAALSTSKLASVTSSHVWRTTTYANRLHQKSRRESLLCYHQCIITKIDSIALNVLRTAFRATSRLQTVNRCSSTSHLSTLAQLIWILDH